MEQLEKIDIIRERLGVSYQEAKEALDQAGGDVVQALIYLENKEKKNDNKIEDAAGKIVDYIRDIVKKGNVTRIRLKKGEKVVFDIPATIGAIGVGGAFLSPILALAGVVGTVAALINNYSLEIVRPDGKVEQHDLKFLTEGQDNNTKDNNPENKE